MVSVTVMSGLRIVGEPANDYPRMSQQIIRLIHAETQPAEGVPAT